MIDQLKPIVDVWETKLLSPAGVEARLKEANIKPESINLNALVTKTHGQSMVPITDKRPALKAVGVFDVVPTTQ
jgi:hypothetical protein